MLIQKSLSHHTNLFLSQGLKKEDKLEKADPRYTCPQKCRS